MCGILSTPCVGIIQPSDYLHLCLHFCESFRAVKLQIVPRGMLFYYVLLVYRIISRSMHTRHIHNYYNISAMVRKSVKSVIDRTFNHIDQNVSLFE